VAKAAKITIVEAENIVPVGEIRPDYIHLQGIYVDRVVPATAEKTIEVLKLRDVQGNGADTAKKSDAQLRRERIAKRTAKELKDGYYVNLGVGQFSRIRLTVRNLALTSIGMPTLAPSFLSPETKVWIQSENGLLGVVWLTQLA
jgi:3-oxoacid CoA-transferase